MIGTVYRAFLVMIVTFASWLSVEGWLSPNPNNQQTARRYQALSISKPSLVTIITRRSSTTSNGEEMPSLYNEQEKLLVTRGEIEFQIMSKNQQSPQPLQATVIRGAGSSGGFGGGGGSVNGGGKSGTSHLKAQAKAYAKIFREEGVLRIDNVLSNKTADALRTYLYDLRKQSENLVRQGKIKTSDRFADVLLKTNRCDMPVPLMGLHSSQWTVQALKEVLLQSPVGQLVVNVFGSEQAVLYELSCLMSDPGSQRQVMHPDNPYVAGRKEATLSTCFIALQDITLDMGPTTWLPRTHTQEKHDMFQDEGRVPALSPSTSTTTSSSTGHESGDAPESPKDKLLRTQPAVLGLLPKGSCGIYDSRLLHCGGANTSKNGISRALFYFSFKNPNVGYPGNPGSLCPELAQASLTWKDITDDLKRHDKGKPTKILQI